MFTALFTGGNGQRLDPSNGLQAVAPESNVTNYLTTCPASALGCARGGTLGSARRSTLGGLLATLGLWAASAFTTALAQEPVVEPVIEEPALTVEPVVEPEAAREPVVEPEVVAEPAAAESSNRAAPVVDPPSRVARLGLAEGEVTVAPAGTEEWAEAVLNRPLTSGDRVWVEKGGKAELQIGSAAVYLDGDTGFGFIELDDDVLQASLTEGVATLRVRRLAEGESIQVETPHSTVYINRVGEYHFEVDKDADRTIVKTRHGEAEVKGGNQKFTVRDNERGVFTGMENVTGHIEPLGARTAFESWANDRDARNERSESAKYVSRDVVGYEDLDDNGEWVREPEYGYVWRPTYISSGWAPYRYGRWVYVSPWGWSWVDDARWGFAPFHYGRWAHVRDRWCWVPGPRHVRPVYAPALVGWVGGPSVGVSLSFGNVGWYPLRPYDVFYPGYRHTPRYIRYVNVSNTIIINDNYYYDRGRRGYRPDWDYRRYHHGISTVSRDHFVGGRPIGNHLVRFNDSEMRRWHGERQPPAIAPYRESVLAGQTRRPPRDADRFRETRRGGDYFAGRVPFHAERRAIESNGGRPVSRTELRDPNRNPKDRGDFFSTRSRTSNGDIKRAERDRASNGLGFSNRDRDHRARELNNDSVREWQNHRDRDRSRGGGGGSSPVYGSRSSSAPRTIDNSREHLEIMRAEESRQDARRRDHMVRPPTNSIQQNSNGFYRPPQEVRDAPRRSDRAESRPWSQPRTQQPRSEPRRDFTPPPRAQPRSEPRSQPQPRTNVDRGQPRSSNHGGSRPIRGNEGSRPREH
jgi:hypothetical protein